MRRRKAGRTEAIDHVARQLGRLDHGLKASFEANHIHWEREGLWSDGIF